MVATEMRRLAMSWSLFCVVLMLVPVAAGHKTATVLEGVGGERCYILSDSHDGMGGMDFQYWIESNGLVAGPGVSEDTPVIHVGSWLGWGPSGLQVSAVTIDGITYDADTLVDRVEWLARCG